jgi:dTDP-4-dehydrorhamnose reductase
LQSILATGLSGLVGTRIRDLLPGYIFTDLSLSTGVDISDKIQVETAFQKCDAFYVLHLAALADVDKCEAEKELAYKVNVTGTKNIVEACRKHKKKLIHISTDFVFCNDLEVAFEDSERKSVNYYAETKILAENEVIAGLPENDRVILRLSHPYKLLIDNEPKKSFFQRMFEILKSGKELTAIEDFLSHPTYIDDIAMVVDKLIQLNLHGVFNCVGDGLISGAEEAEKICDVFGFNKKLIKLVKLDDYFKGRAKRPRRLNLNNDKIKKATGIKMRSFNEGLLDIKHLMQ